MKRKWKGLILLLTVVLLLLCGTHALAESIQPVPAERIQRITLPKGLVTIGDPIITDGKVTVRVDNAKTNWTEVLMKAASREGLDVSLFVTAPEGMTKATRENFGATDTETIDPIKNNTVPTWFADYACDLGAEEVDGSAIFAEIHFGETTYVVPTEATGAGTVICWENASGARQYEYVQWEIIHSDPSAREAEMPAITQEMLSSVPDALPTGVTAEIEMGGVTCTVNDFPPSPVCPSLSMRLRVQRKQLYTSARRMKKGFPSKMAR